MAKISPVAAKYIIHTNIQIEGVVDKPDVIGAIFGQTEGLLGSELELRELQRSGRIGRIEVNLKTKSGKTEGEIIIPSSMDKAETSIIGAAMEVINRIGPCNAQVKVEKIEDVRISKRNFLVERAKELLKQMIDDVLPDSQEISDEVAYSVRTMEIQKYGREKLPAGPAIDDSEEIIVVEGRADVLTLLKHGFKNVIALEGSNAPKTIIDLSKQKIVTAFLDGDRGGDLELKELLQRAELDFVARAPDGKEVEELTKKEIHKALRGRIAAEQAKLDMKVKGSSRSPKKYDKNKRNDRNDRRKSNKNQRKTKTFTPKNKKKPTKNEKEIFASKIEDLIGTKGAFILDEKLNILGKVPIKELNVTIKSLKSGIYAVILDSSVDKNLLYTAERAGIPFVVGLEKDVDDSKSGVNVITADEL